MNSKEHPPKQDEENARRSTAANKPLQSWKEIATYLDRDVRTTRRWEQAEGLPIRRHRSGSSRSSVYAYPSELEAWRAQRMPKAGQESYLPRWRHLKPALAGGLAVLAVAAFLQWGPILNPPDPLAQAADVGDGVNLRQVWTGTGVDVMGSISPDGRYLSFVNWATGDLGLRDLMNAENRNLTNKGSQEEIDEFPESSVISPDGRQVAYAWFNDRSFYDLRLIGIEGVAGGQDPKVLYSNPELYYIVPVDFFPDGRRILALFQRKDRSVQIAIFGIEDQSVNVLKTVDWRRPRKTALSPDGRYIAYDFPAGEGEAPRDIFLLAADGSREISLVSHPSNDEVLGWTPDGSALLFASDRGGRRGAWLLPVTDGKAQEAPTLVKSELDVEMAIGFSRGGSFYYGFRTGMQDIYTVALDLEAGELLGVPKKLTQRFVGSNRSPAWSTDGKYMAYLSRRNDRSPGSYTIVIRSMETGQERDIHPQTGYIAQVTWAPDGRSLYFASPDERSRWTVFRLNVDTEELTTLVAPEEEDAYYFSVAVSPDGRTLYYGALSFSETEGVIRARDLRTGHEREIYKVPERSFRFTLSPDGRLLALLQQSHTPDMSLHVLPVEGGDPQELVRLQKPESMGSNPIWTADSRHILFWKRQDGQSGNSEGELWSAPIDGGSLRRISAEYQRHVPQALHPDGRQIALTAGRDRREIWAMENFLPDRVAAK